MGVRIPPSAPHLPDGDPRSSPSVATSSTSEERPLSETVRRVALVTGAASGIGLATAELLASRGAHVALLSLPDDDLGAAVDQVGRHGTDVLAVGADVGDPGAVRDAFREVEAALGPVDWVHNNAGRSLVSPLVDTSDQAFEALVRTNVAGAFHVLREAARAMAPRRRGAVVNTASELALVGQAGYVAYSATKGAILAMSRSAAAELAPSGIRVNAVCPGATETPMLLAELTDPAGPGGPGSGLEASGATVPLGRVAQAREIAEAVAFLLSDQAGYITGTQLTVDGGITSCVTEPTTGGTAG